jgi:hypothetical protein
MKWRTCGAHALPYDRPLQLLVRRLAQRFYLQPITEALKHPYRSARVALPTRLRAYSDAIDAPNSTTARMAAMCGWRQRNDSANKEYLPSHAVKANELDETTQSAE